MKKVDAKKLYKEIKRGAIKFDEEVHCTMLLMCFDNDGTRTSFCKDARISDGLFSKWCKIHPVFNDCYQVAKAIGKANWEKEGDKRHGDSDFDMSYWKMKGNVRYNPTKARIKLEVNPEASPFTQYKQICSQAADGAYTASEIKQLMESINVGIRAYESEELQKRIDELTEDLEKMRLHHANNSRTIEAPKKTD